MAPSQGGREWQEVLTFATEVTSGFTVSPEGARVGVVLIPDQGGVALELGAITEQPSLQDAIMGLSNVATSARVADAVKMTREKCFRRDRPGVPSLAIVYTRGIPPDQMRDVQREVGMLERSGVSVLAVDASASTSQPPITLQSRGSANLRVAECASQGNIKDTVREMACNALKQPGKFPFLFNTPTLSGRRVKLGLNVYISNNIWFKVLIPKRKQMAPADVSMKQKGLALEFQVRFCPIACQKAESFQHDCYLLLFVQSSWLGLALGVWENQNVLFVVPETVTLFNCRTTYTSSFSV